MFKVIASPRGVAVAGLLLSLSSSVFAATFTVTTTADSGPGSLRQAILDANVNVGADTIDFNIPGTGPFTIISNSDLIVSDATTIDATTQPGYAGAPLVELIAPAPLASTYGIKLEASNCRVSGIAFGLFGNGLYSSGQSNQVITRNYFGLRADGVTPAGNVERGVYLLNCTNSFVGRSGEGNVASGNVGASGITLISGRNNQVAGNIAGPDASGSLAIRNKRGIELNGEVDTLVGGYAPGEGNQASANTETGIHLSFCTRITLAGNLIGPQKNGFGTFPAPPSINTGQQFGIQNVVCTDTAIGVPGIGWGNTLGDNGQSISFQSSTRGTIQNNIFGADPTGLIGVRTNQGCQINVSTDVKIGGAGANEGNRFVDCAVTAVSLFSSQRTLIKGNIFALKPDNTFAASSNLGISMHSSDDTVIGGALPGERNVMCGLDGGGIHLNVSHRVIVKGNLIGIDPSGTLIRGSTRDPGIALENCNNVVIGGAGAGEGNVIVDFDNWGIKVGESNACNGTQIIGNRIGIGINSPSQAAPNSRGGIDILKGINNRISQNLIAFSAPLAGFAGLGIDIGNDGVTANDAGDADTGPNNYQNYPVITQFEDTGSGIRMVGSLNSTPSTAYTLEFFKNDSFDNTNFGEGQYYLGSAVVSTDSSGNATFDVTFPGSLTTLNTVAATATDPNGNTSEFSAAAGENRAPSANAGIDRTVTIPHDGSPVTNTTNVTITGTGSDPDGDALTYSWSDGSGVVGTAAILTIALPAGTHTLTLTVTDPDGESASDSVIVTVNPEPNATPTANAGVDQSLTIVHDGDPATNTRSFTLNATGTDSNNDPLTYAWSEGATPVGSTQSLTLSRVAGTYVFTVMVSDAYGASAQDTVQITINPEPNTAPSVTLITSKTVTIPHDGSPVTNTAQSNVTATVSDSNGDTLSIVWRDSSSNIVGTAALLDIPLTQGVHVLTITATDPYGAATSRSVTITVLAEPNAAPTVSLVSTKSVAIPHDGDPATNTAQSNVTATISDSNGDSFTIAWKDNLGNTLSTSPTLDIPLTQGSHVFTVTATDAYNSSTSRSITITVTAEPNGSPTANAGLDQTTTLPHDGDPNTNTHTFTLNGSGTDPDNDVLTYTWLEGSTPVGSGQSLTLTRVVGVYTFTLRVTDPYGANRTDPVVIRINAEPNSIPAPPPAPGGNFTVPHDGDPATNTVTVTLGPATYSPDPDGDTLSFQWQDASGNIVGTTQQITVTLTPGTYRYKLGVTDGYIPYFFSALGTVTVNPESNSAPTFSLATTKTITVPHDGSTATNTAMSNVVVNATDPNNDTLTYAWKDSSNSLVSSTGTLDLPLTVGTHSFSLTVTDPYGLSLTRSIAITVNAEPNAGPAALAGEDETVTGTPSTATFTLSGVGSSDPDNDILTYLWQEGATTVGSTQNVSVSRPVGTYTFTLTVTDPYGESATDTVTITVRSSNQPPQAIVGAAISIAIPHDGAPETNTRSVILDGSGSNDPDADQALTYVWKDANNVVLGTSAQITLTLEAGSYLYRLTVTDPHGETSSATQSVTVLPEPNDGPSVDAGLNQIGVADLNGQASFTVSAIANDPDNDALSIRWYEGATQIGTGASLSTTLAAGTHVLTVIATDSYGISASDTVTVSVQYTGTFFLQPINNDGSSIFKQGSTVPVKFELTGISAGATIVARIYIAKVTNNVIGTEMEPVSTAQADSGNIFRSGGGNQWIFNLNTKNLTPGTYQIRADLGDGALHTVLISLKP